MSNSKQVAVRLPGDLVDLLITKEAMAPYIVSAVREKLHEIANLTLRKASLRSWTIRKTIYPLGYRCKPRS
jgi:hypothetical protein